MIGTSGMHAVLDANDGHEAAGRDSFFAITEKEIATAGGAPIADSNVA